MNLNNTWFQSYGNPNKLNNILEDNNIINESIQPLFKNIKHTHDTHYTHNNIKEVNHNMLEGQPSFQHENLLKPYKDKTIMELDFVRNYDINKINIPTTHNVPWDMFQELNKNNNNNSLDDKSEYSDERNFKNILNHPSYNNIKPFIEQPFKYI